MEFLPRVIRAKNAHVYLGMDRNRFNREVKPHLIAVPIGVQGLGYDRFDLDKWWEEYNRRNGMPGALLKAEGEEQWVEKLQDSVAGQTSPAERGTFTRCSTARQFMKVVAQVTKKKKRKST